MSRSAGRGNYGASVRPLHASRSAPTPMAARLPQGSLSCMSGHPSDVVLRGSRACDLVCRYLDNHGVEYELIEHRPAFTAANEALAAGVEPRNAAKTLALVDAGDYRLAVIPAMQRLDLAMARQALDASDGLRLAGEAELERDFAVFELGALPPFAALVPAPAIIDPRLLEHDRILCSAGTHSHSVLIDPRDLLRLSEVFVADVCRSWLSPSSPLERY